jgi:hypothetical protein
MDTGSNETMDSAAAKADSDSKHADPNAIEVEDDGKDKRAKLRKLGLDLPMVGDLLKVVAVLGTSIYAVLFIGYRSYYSVLGIHPEDVGVSHSFILVRSIGLILSAIMFAALITVIFHLGKFILWTAESDWNWRRYMLAFCSIIVIAFFAGQIVSLILSALQVKNSLELRVITPLAFVLTLLLVYGFIKIPALNKFAYVGLVFAILVAVLLPAVAIDNRANQLGASAAHGIPVKPFTIFGMPVLDISSEEAVATWICPMAQRPPIFNGSSDNAIHGMVVGDTGTKIFILYSAPEKNAKQSADKDLKSHQIISFPQTCVMVSRSLGD